jgi:hypothetical protein
MKLRSGRILSYSASLMPSASCACAHTHITESIIRHLYHRVSECIHIQNDYTTTTKKYWTELARCVMELYYQFSYYYNDIACDDIYFINLIRTSRSKAIYYKRDFSNAIVQYQFKEHDKNIIRVAIQELDAFILLTDGI